MLVLLLYAVAAVAYVLHFVRRHPRAGRAATAALVGGILVQTFTIGMQTVHTAHVPLAGTGQIVAAFAWLLALAYLAVEVTTDERSMGVFILPLVAALAAVAAAGPPPEARPDVLDSGWFALHVVSLLFAYASFGLAGVMGVTYVLLFRELKGRTLGFFFTRLPSLDVLDRMNLRAATIGWVCLTVGVLGGAIWAVQAHAGGVTDPRVAAMSIGDPKIAVAILCWIVYAFQVIAWRTIGWRGRRAAWLSTVGLAIVLLNLMPVSWFLSSSHDF